MNNFNKDKEDLQLLRAIQAEKSWALNKIMDDMFPVLCTLVQELVKDRMAAEDIAIEAITKTLAKRIEFQKLRSLKKYMKVTARNAGYNFLRDMAAMKRKPNEAATDREPSEADADYTIIRADVIKVANETLKGFSSRQQLIARYSLWEGLSDEEIAEKLKISVKTVQNNKSTIIQKLLDRIRKIALPLFIILLVEIKSADLPGKQPFISVIILRTPQH